ncbi:acyltransferase [Marinicella sediminis]|uniref:Acyltransferase n=1 Tax=Marinicella sediminis TaxID=1792834 RepID=A0ABV7J8E3_9GAMM|nr:acyltransferase [Marinicella sediminis]
MLHTLKGILAALVFILNTVFMVTLLLILALFKFLIPIPGFRVWVSRWLVGVAESWVTINSQGHRLLHGEKIMIEQMPELNRDEWYLVVANHRSMVDIPVLQAVFNKQIPFLKFFLKQQLIWVPFLGLAWWALDFPFMKRYSRAFVKKHPHLKGKDMEQTQKSCEKFKHFPTTVINFVEGTRFTVEKHQAQQSPYEYLLKPKAGGIGFVLGSMGEQMKQLLLVTVAYPGGAPSFWQYLSGRFAPAMLSCEKIVIPDTLLNKNYQTDENFKRELFKWSENLWYKQDNKLQAIYERTDI